MCCDVTATMMHDDHGENDMMITVMMIMMVIISAMVMMLMVDQEYVRTEYVLNQYLKYRYVLLCHNTPSFSENGSPDSISTRA